MRRVLFPGLLLGTALLLTACPQTPPPPPPPPSSGSCSPVATGLTVQGALARTLEEPAGLGDFTAPYVSGELLVLFGTLTPQSLFSRVPDVRVQGRLPGGFVHLKVPKGQEIIKAKEILKAGAQYVQPNYIYYPLTNLNNSYLSPNDPLYSIQSSQLQNLLGLDKAWAIHTGNPDLIMAVIDTGYQVHTDMDRWYLPENQILDVANSDSDPTDDTPETKAPQNPFSHGLAVASVLGASTNNQQVMAAVTWLGKVLPLKVARSDGTISVDSVAQAVRIAADLGAKVINISLGGPADDEGLEKVLQDARNMGVVIVAAAGNDGANGILYPARSPGVLAVGSVDNSGSKSSFSNCGSELDLVAPGRNVIALLPRNGYGQASGTSFASPMVAGVAALYMGRYFQLYNTWPSPDQVYLCLTGTARDLGPSGHDTGYGFGLVRADRVMTDTTYCFP